MQVILDGVSKRYSSGFFAVKNLSLEIKSGELHFLLGPSGCGKTTLLRLLAGLESVSSGRIFFAGEDVTNKDAAQRGIGMVFQNYALWPHMTVWKNVEYGLKLKKLPESRRKRRLSEVLAWTSLEDKAEHYPAQLSGGQQQRVALARALAIEPSILLLDEPLSNLDAKLRLEMRHYITKIHRESGVTMLYVTHDQKEALSMGTTVSVLNHGELLQSGSPRDLYLRPQSVFLAGFIGESNFIAGKVKEVRSGGVLVSTVLGDIYSEHVLGGFSCGDQVCLSIRPESIKLDLGSGVLPDLNRLSACLQQVTYLGEVEQLEFTYGQGDTLRLSLFNAPEYDLKVGQEGVCYVDPARVLTLEDRHV